MLPIYICEDAQIQLDTIKNIIKNYILIEELDMEIVCSTQDPYELLEYLKQNKKTGLYFLDIDFNCDINGIELGKEIRKYAPRGFIVFTTNYSEMAMLTFKYQVEAMDFIIKENNVNFNNKIINCLHHAYKLFYSSENTSESIISIKTKTNIITIPKKDVIFLKSEPENPHYIKIIGKDFIYSFHGTLSNIIKQLGKSFNRCEKSYIVNMAHIKKIDK